MVARPMNVTFNCLVVDDLKFHRMLLQHVIKVTLNKLGIKSSCEEASSEEEVLAHCAEKIFHLIIMDYHMEPKNGSEITKSLLKKYPDVYVIGYTASNEKGVREACLESGMREVFNKDANKVKNFLERYAKNGWGNMHEAIHA